MFVETFTMFIKKFQMFVKKKTFEMLVQTFKKFVKTIDQPVPVILIEVMILEVNRSAITETGISFGIGDRPQETRGEFFPSGNVSIGAQDVNKIIGNFNGFGSLNIGNKTDLFNI